MAGGWARDGAVQDQIDDTIKDAVEAARARLLAGEGSDDCDDCGEPIAKSGGRHCPERAPAWPASQSATSRSFIRQSTGAVARTASFDRPWAVSILWD